MVSLDVVIGDPGRLDAHTLNVRWGDDGEDVYDMMAGEKIVTISHRYADDDPSRTSSDEYVVMMTIMDDDGAYGEGTANVIVANLDPEVRVTNMDVVEPNRVLISVMVKDPSASDTFTLVIDWGDGGVPREMPMEGDQVGLRHDYDVPGTYMVTIRAFDDDEGEGYTSTSVTIGEESIALSLEVGVGGPRRR